MEPMLAAAAVLIGAAAFALDESRAYRWLPRMINRIRRHGRQLPRRGSPPLPQPVAEPPQRLLG